MRKLRWESSSLHMDIQIDMLVCMRTSIDIPDALLERVRARLRKEGRTLKQAVIDGLRQTVLAEDRQTPFELRDASFSGDVGFGPGFDENGLTDAVRKDAEARLVAEEAERYEK